MSNIKKGDLVMIVKPKKCCGKGTLGFTFIVEDVYFDTESSCSDCGDSENELVADESDTSVIALSRLKKIDPEQDEDSVIRQIELVAS